MKDTSNGIQKAMMLTTLTDEWIKTIQLFGDVESVIKEALKFYSIDQCKQRIRKAADQISFYNGKYHFNYNEFKQTIQTDEKFLSKVETQNPLWEEDAMEWEYWHEEHQEWQNRLEAILRQ